jgi:nucleotide-binding universal stress UspA family protein
MATLLESHVPASCEVVQTKAKVRAGGSVLVATDASPSCDAAIKAARAIAAQTGWEVGLLAVHVPMPITTPEVQVPATAEMNARARESLEAAVREQLDRLSMQVRWPLAVVSGDPAAVIANVARNTRASLVVMGLGAHGLLDRLVGDEMMLQVVRLGTVPVLGVAPGFSGLPSRAVAAVDFSASCARALKVGARLIDTKGRLTLAHVLPKDVSPEGSSDIDVAYSASVGRSLDRMVEDIDVHEGVAVSRTLLHGDPAKALLRCASDRRADLIIAGSHGLSFVSQLLLGSVSTKLVRKAQCSVLVAPPEDAPCFLDEPELTDRMRFVEWVERLEEFTRRNAGRRAVLEVVDPNLGAQISENHVPFVGATYDAREGQVYMMFGGDRGQHFTRSIRGVTAIQLLRDRLGRDLFLRVAHGRGQTLLTLER